MSEDFYRSFDYYNAEPPRESVAPPPEEATAAVPEDEYNERVHVSSIPRRKAKSIAFMLAISGLATTFVIPGMGLIQAAQDITEESSVIEETVSGNKNGETSAETTPAPTPTPTPSPTPTPVPVATEDVRVRLDSFEAYQLEKGFLAEVRFTLATNCGTEITSITGALDSNIFVYDGYDFKKKKEKSHYEKYHHDFSLDPSAVAKVEGTDLIEKQYSILVSIPKDLSSEDKFNVTLTVSNTLNGNKTEDKTVTLNDVAIWNDDANSYGTMYNISVTKNDDKSFDVTITPKSDDVPLTEPRLEGIYVWPKKGTDYFSDKDFKVTKDGFKFHIEFKNPKKAPSKGRLTFTTFVKFERTDSTGTKFTGSAHGHISKDY